MDELEFNPIASRRLVESSSKSCATIFWEETMAIAAKNKLRIVVMTGQNSAFCKFNIFFGIIANFNRRNMPKSGAAGAGPGRQGEGNGGANGIW